MTGAADFTIEEVDEGARLRLSGDWTTTGLGRVGERLSRDLSGRPVKALALDDLGRFDTAGALALVKASERLPKDAWGDRPEAGRLYAAIEKLERKAGSPPRRAHPVMRTFAKIGRGIYDFLAEAVLSFAFLGRLITAV